MSASSLSHRDRVRLALDHRPTDRIPIAMVCSRINAPAHDALAAHLRQTRDVTVEEYLAPLLDIKEVAPQYVGPALGEGESYWGVIRKPVSYGPACYMEIAHYPLAAAETIDDLDSHRWPTTEWFDYSSLPDQIAAIDADEPYCLIGPGGNPFESSWYMRGFEQSFMDMIERPDLLTEILRRVTDFFIAHTTKTLAAARGRIDLAFTADDIGGQNGLLLSLDMWREMLKGHHVRLNRAIHEHGAKVIYHSDGAVSDAVGELVDMGIDILQALQFDADGMDPVAMKDRYGDRLCFEGGISVQQTLPFGSADGVADEVRRRIEVLGRDGGYILGPSHVIQAGTPPENILAMFDTAAATPMPD